MSHTSIRLNAPIEFVNVTPVNPLISKCQIKVCYVGEQPNRNGSVITKDTAKEMANSLPGSPIVGYYNEKDEDFEEHNRTIDISNGRFEMKDTTRPYGFVSMDAKVWFEKFQDDGVEHEYLMTEGYLWTGQYPECQRVIEKGNNQSMELDEKTLNAQWAKDSNGNPEFFIINEAIISKLCILGENVEPCFEGATISKIEFSFGDSFKEELFSLMKQMKEILNEGGASMSENIENVQIEEETSAPEESVDFAMNQTEAEAVVEELAETEDFAKKDKEEDKAKDDEKADAEDSSESKDDSSNDSEDEEDKKKKKYNLEEVEEYTELLQNYNELKDRYSALEAEMNEVKETNKTLAEFKLSADRAEKQSMIDKFFMVPAEDKEDVIKNIDTYSLDDIEAKLAVICIRKGLNFTQEENHTDTTTFSLSDSDNLADESVPAWIKAVLDTEKTLN